MSTTTTNSKASALNINGSISIPSPAHSHTDTSECNNLNENETLDNIFNPFRGNSLSNSLSSSFGQSKMMDTHDESIKSLNLLNSSFSTSLLNNSDFNASNNNNSTGASLQCGICGKYPMINGKTLVGCLHSFCHPCLIQSTLSSLCNSSVIACPICSQETLMPTGGVDALMPHYSNPMLLSLSQELNNSNGPKNTFMNLAVSGYQTQSSISSTSSASSPVINGNKSKYNMLSAHAQLLLIHQTKYNHIYNYVINCRKFLKNNLIEKPNC